MPGISQQIKISRELHVFEFFLSHTAFGMAMWIMIPGFYFNKMQEFSFGGYYIDLAVPALPVSLQNFITILCQPIDSHLFSCFPKIIMRGHILSLLQGK